MSWPCCEEAAQVDSNIHHPAYLCGSVDHLSAPYAIWTLQPLPALVCQIVEVCPSLCHNGIVIVSKLAQREHRDMAELASSGHKVACYKRRAWRLPPTILSKKSLTNELKDPLSLAPMARAYADPARDSGVLGSSPLSPTHAHAPLEEFFHMSRDLAALIN